MLRTNLSTRPFYNIRAVEVTLGALGVLLALLTLVNLVQLVRLTSSERTLGARAAQAESEAQRLREEARRIRARINAKELNDVATAAQEANSIIDLRAFSWSDLFAQLEANLPENVRLTSFEPSEGADGRFRVTLRVQARRVQDLEMFLDALEMTGLFQDVLASEEQAGNEGLFNAVVESVYMQSGQPPSVAGAPDRPRGEGVAGE